MKMFCKFLTEQVKNIMEKSVNVNKKELKSYQDTKAIEMGKIEMRKNYIYE